MAKMCDMCGMHEATIFFKKTINGVTTEKNLCPHCAAIVEQNNLVDDVLGEGSLISQIFGMQSCLSPKKNLRVCPNCGISDREVAETGKFGCSECYEAFRDLAERYVSELGGRVYAGHKEAIAQDAAKREEKVAKSEPIKEKRSKPDPKQSELERLQALKKQAVEREDYLTAAKLNEQIKALSQKK